MDIVTAPLALTPGEPAGIGPDLCVQLAASERALPLVAVADPELLAARARHLGVALRLETFAPGMEAARDAGRLSVLPVPLERPADPGRLDPVNARYVLATLDAAVDHCLGGDFGGLVTGPVHKGVINTAGIAFSGHTEYLAARTGTPRVVMMLAKPGLRVALATTHLPLAEVPRAITAERLHQVLAILHQDLATRLGLPKPRILVCGLNPHAGEEGHMGREEIEVITPVLDTLRRQGLDLIGPVPADTAFTPAQLAEADVVLAMYHDQGLPVLKHRGFGQAVNVTLGLPLVRTSVDHGTALTLAGSGRAHGGSLAYAIEVAAEMAGAR